MRIHPWGGTYIVAVDVGIGFLHVVAIFLDGMAESYDVVVGMVAHLVALGLYTFEEFGILTHVVAHHEEGGLGVELLECLENEWGSLGDWAVVESQVYCPFVTVHSPVGFRVEPAEIDGWLLDDHLIIPETFLPWHDIG